MWSSARSDKITAWVIERLLRYHSGPAALPGTRGFFRCGNLDAQQLAWLFAGHQHHRLGIEHPSTSGATASAAIESPGCRAGGPADPLSGRLPGRRGRLARRPRRQGQGGGEAKELARSAQELLAGLAELLEVHIGLGGRRWRPRGRFGLALSTVPPASSIVDVTASLKRPSVAAPRRGARTPAPCWSLCGQKC